MKRKTKTMKNLVVRPDVLYDKPFGKWVVDHGYVLEYITIVIQLLLLIM